MDQKTWVTDKFYLQFPSYSEQNRKRELLAKTRQLEYQKYLKQLTFINDSPSSRPVKRGANNEENLKRAKVPDLFLPLELDSGRTSERSNTTIGKSERDIENTNSKTKFLSGLQHMNLPDILNEDVIKERNRRTNEEKNRKKLQYQRDLLTQIEQKKQENEKRKAKEKEEEERLTMKMEEQLRAVRLEMEKEQERENCERDSKRNAVEQRKSTDQAETSKHLESPKITYHNSLERRNAYSENEKENLIVKKADKDLYKYFSNSAKDTNDLKNTRYRTSNKNDIESFLSPSSILQPSSTQEFCLDCQSDVKKNLCSFCQQQRFLLRNQSENTTDRNLFMCTLCQADPICRSCQKKICQKCKKPIRKDRKNKGFVELPMSNQKPETDLSNPYLSPQKNENSFDLSGSRSPSRIFETEVFRRSNNASKNSYINDNNDADDDQSSLLSVVRKPFSLNLEKSSVFHPLNKTPKKRFSINIKNGEVVVEQNGLDSLEELKRITDEKIAKFIKNYGELPSPKPFKKKSIDIDEFPIPLHVEQSKSPIEEEFRRDSIESNSPAFKMLETKWDIPVVQRNTIKENDNNVCVLTQVGAFKKQLQLDQFEFDDFDNETHSHKN